MKLLNGEDDNEGNIFLMIVFERGSREIFSNIVNDMFMLVIAYLNKYSSD
jgi:hypothetical protein